MDITVTDSTGNKFEEATVPDNIPTGRIVAKLVELMEMPAMGVDGIPISYKFHHKRTGQQIADDETLAAAGVRDGDVLRLVAEITAG